MNFSGHFRKKELRQRAKMALLFTEPISPPPIELMSQTEPSVAQQPNVPVRRKVSRFEVFTSPNLTAAIVSETGRMQIADAPQRQTSVCSLLSDPLAMTRITVEPDDKEEVNI